MIIKTISYESLPQVQAIGSYHVSDTFNPPLACYSGLAAFDADGTMLAYITVMPESPRLNSIPSLATRQGYEGRGLMRALFTELFRRYPGTFWLEVHGANKRALGLYESVGFKFTEGVGTYRDGSKCLLGEREG